MIGTEIKYTIDNFSGIKSVDESFIANVDLKGVYILYDKDKEPLYIGKSRRCLRSRLLVHLRNKIKHYLLETKLFEEYKRTKYKYYSYIEADDDFVNLLEVGLIRKFKPKFNKEYNSKFKYDDDWKEYLEANKYNAV